MVSYSSRNKVNELVKDFIAYRLRKAGYDNWGNGNLDSYSPTTEQRTLRLLGDEFESAYFDVFDDMTGTINIYGADLKDAFTSIADAVFVNHNGGIQWGRIVGLFVLSAKLCVKAMDCNRPDIVDLIVIWTTDYLDDNRFSTWISQHGGWVSEVQV